MRGEGREVRVGVTVRVRRVLPRTLNLILRPTTSSADPGCSLSTACEPIQIGPFGKSKQPSSVSVKSDDQGRASGETISLSLICSELRPNVPARQWSHRAHGW